MKTIPLTKGVVALVDDQDHTRLSKHKWCAALDHHSGTFYAIRHVVVYPNARRKRGTGRRVTVHMHREIMNAQPGWEVDHVSGVGYDNRRQNLRLCTRAENSYNQRPTQGKSSRYKGVSWCKKQRKWRALLGYNGRQIHLGRYYDEVDAALAYDQAARKYFGEFCRLNFPDVADPEQARQRRVAGREVAAARLGLPTPEAQAKERQRAGGGDKRSRRARRKRAKRLASSQQGASHHAITG